MNRRPHRGGIEQTPFNVRLEGDVGLFLSFTFAGALESDVPRQFLGGSDWYPFRMRLANLTRHTGYSDMLHF